MSLILKGIDMPKDIDELSLIINGMSIAIEPTQVIQIPKGHGRLIDGDEMQSKAYERYFVNTISPYGMFEVNRAIEDAPTILEAER